MPSASIRPTAATRASRPSRSMVSSTASAAAHATGFPPNVLPWSPLCSAVPDARPDRQPAAEPLREREHVRHDARGLAGEPGTGAPDPGLDLVEHQQRAGRVARLPRAPQVAGWGRHHSRLPLAGLEDDGGTLTGDG